MTLNESEATSGSIENFDENNNKFFFMHIAKTAGSFVNQVLTEGFGENFVPHCETCQLVDPDSPALWKSFWSGHLYLHRWRRVEEQHGWNVKRFTILREPMAQLASHILWIDHYGLPEFKKEYVRLDADTRVVVDQVKSTDLSDCGDIDRLLTTLHGRGIQYFDNCQSRYFIAGNHSIGLQEPLHLGMKTELEKAIKEFTYIGIGEQMGQFIEKLSHEVGVPLTNPNTRVNEAKAQRKIDLTIPGIREVLSKRLSLDNWLYETVKHG